MFMNGRYRKRRKGGIGLRGIIDLAMSVLMLLLISSRYTGLWLHELFGILLICFMIVHQALNARWYRVLGKGKYTAARRLLSAADFCLLADMILLAVSGIAMGREIIPPHLLPIDIMTAREIHLVCGYLGFLLTGFHLGLHVDRIPALRRIRNMSAQLQGVRSFGTVLLVAVCGFGVYGLVHERYFSYVFGQMHFVLFGQETVAFYIAEMIGIWILVAVISALLQEHLVKRNSK